jgi:hypothetical protein
LTPFSVTVKPEVVEEVEVVSADPLATESPPRLLEDGEPFAKRSRALEEDNDNISEDMTDSKMLNHHFDVETLNNVVKEEEKSGESK